MINKKIQKSDTLQTNGSYALNLLEYITNPEVAPCPDADTDHKPDAEKCVYAEALNYSHEGISVTDQAKEMGTLCKSVRNHESMNLVSHWIMSWKADENPSQEQIIGAAKDHLRDMGFGPDHLATIAIHVDTDNIHVHTAACRVSLVDGSVLQEGNGWWKNEAQRFCARQEHLHGWKPEDKGRFVATGEMETVRTVNKFTGEQVEQQRPAVKKSGKSGEAKALRDRAKRQEMITGLRSHQGSLQDVLAELRPSIEASMKWGAVHKLLAEHGVTCELREHGIRAGLTYSLNGIAWEKAGSVDPFWSLDNLEKFLGKRFRHARGNVQEIADNARKHMEARLTKETEFKTVYSKEQIAALRTIPVSEVRQAFGLPESDSKKIRNAVDVLVYQKDVPYAEAVDALARRFPSVVSGEDLVNAIDNDTISKRLELAGVPESLRRTGSDVLKQLDAWGCERFHVYGNAPNRNFSSAQQNPEGWTKTEVLQNIGYLAAINTQGGHIFVDPQYGDDKIKIPVDEVQQSFIDKYRPSMILNTSREKQQAHYVIERKYEKEFYDILTENINYQFGDKKILTADHDSRLAGFTNRKPAYEDENGNFPFVKVQQSTPVRCIEFERYVDEQYVLYKQGKLKSLNPEKKLGTLSTDAERKAAMEGLTERTMPPVLTNQAIAYQGKLRQQYGANMDRSRADYMTADFLYRSGAMPDQVYGFMRQHALQDNELVTRRHQDGSEYKTRKNVSEAGRDRHARRTAVNAYFDKGYATATPSSPLPDLSVSRPASASRWKQKQTPIPAPVSGVLIDASTRTHELEKQAIMAQAKAETAAKAAEEIRLAEAKVKAQAEEAAVKAANKTSEGKAWRQQNRERRPSIRIDHAHKGSHNGQSGPRM